MHGFSTGLIMYIRGNILKKIPRVPILFMNHMLSKPIYLKFGEKGSVTSSVNLT